MSLKTRHHSGITVKAKNEQFAQTVALNLMFNEHPEREYRVERVSLLTPQERKRYGLQND